MPNLLAFDPAQYVGFIVIFARISGVFLTAPVLSDGNVPAQVKVAFIFVLALVFFSALEGPQVPSQPAALQVLLLTGGEFAVGLLIGFAARVLLAGVNLAGEIIGFQMGIGLAAVVDPNTGAQFALLGEVLNILALLLFVVLDGHHMFIQAIAMSYRVVEPGGIQVGQPLFQGLMDVAANLFVVGLRVGAPLIAAMLAANFSIGLIARTVPQINIFIVGLPFTIGLGLLLLALGFPFFIEAVSHVIRQVQEAMGMVIQQMGGANG